MERRIDSSFTPDAIKNACVISGQGMNCFRTFLEHWAGKCKLVEADFNFLEDNIHLIIEIVKVKGVCHESVAKQIFGQFVYGKHIEALSDLALKLLAMQEMAKPAEEGQVGNFVSCWINHPDFLNTEKEKYEA